MRWLPTSTAGSYRKSRPRPDQAVRQRPLLMAALVLSDELHDLREQRGITAQSTGKSDPKVGRRLRGIAKRAEAIADSAEARPLASTPDAKAEQAETIAATSEPT